MVKLGGILIGASVAVIAVGIIKMATGDVKKRAREEGAMGEVGLVFGGMAGLVGVMMLSSFPATNRILWGGGQAPSVAEVVSNPTVILE